MSDEGKNLGPCPICGREMVAGRSVNVHHLVPKSLKGKETITLHVVCHSKIHSVFTERELLNHFYTIERIREHPEIEKFVRWLQNKPADFRARNRSTNEKKTKKRKKG